MIDHLASLPPDQVARWYGRFADRIESEPWNVPDRQVTAPTDVDPMRQL